MSPITPKKVDELLPQTQCGLCGYGGCLPYAKAIVEEKAPLNLCPPGGRETLEALGQLLQQDVSALIPSMEKKPKAIAKIRETACIGCTKCIAACPVDAILGAAKQMHTVIADFCTGCELCVPPCPVDCIDLLPSSEPPSDIRKAKAKQSRQRFNARQMRLAKEKFIKPSEPVTVINRKAYIAEVILRKKIR